MGPNIEEVEVKYNIGDTIIQAALPFNKPIYQRIEEKEEKKDIPEIRSDEPSISDDPEEVDPLRISTRGRFTYELDRYNKNAMLIFEGNSSDIAFESHSEAEDNIDHDEGSTRLKQTFENFRFEVEVHRNLDDDEIASICDRFFQRDFTEYGCVAVVMLAKTKNGIVETSHTPNSEFGVLRYLSDLLPPTLQDKPKIYIVQTEGYYVIPRARVWSRVPQDTLEFRIPVPIISSPDASGKRSKLYCLLEYLDYKLNNAADNFDLYTTLADTVNEFVRRCAVFDMPVGFYSSLTKELCLTRAPKTL